MNVLLKIAESLQFSPTEGMSSAARRKAWAMRQTDDRFLLNIGRRKKRNFVNNRPGISPYKRNIIKAKVEAPVPDTAPITNGTKGLQTAQKGWFARHPLLTAAAALGTTAGIGGLFGYLNRNKNTQNIPETINY